MGETAAENSKIALLGASRGLGRECCLFLNQHAPGTELFLLARSEPQLTALTTACANLSVTYASVDFSQPVDQLRALQQLSTFSPDRLIYLAAGGPYGSYHSKKWQDHEWAWQVTFAFAAKLLLWSNEVTSLRQLVFIGSAIAESRPDPNAASYCAAKHALRGLVESVQLEITNGANRQQLDLRLFSPGYMDTSMLPPNSWPRRQGLVRPAAAYAAHLFSWLDDDTKRCGCLSLEL